MILGVYNTYLSAVSIVNMNVINPMLIGVIIGSLIFMKIIKILLNKFHFQTIMGIIGFSIGSVFLIEVNTGVLAVVAVDNNYASLCSRGFCYSECNKKETLKESKEYFKQVQDCLRVKNLKKLEELDLF